MNAYFVIAFVLLSAVATAPDTDPTQHMDDISVNIPGAGEIEAWEPTGIMRTFVGEDLYSLINGGAVIFYEYGFKQAVTQDYAGADGKPISLQIYQMNNPASAYGVYTLKSSTGGKDIDIGHEGMLADYYLHFWKGDLLAILMTTGSDEATQRGLVRIARAVDGKIKTEGQRPSLVDLLSIEGREVQHIIYLRGDLALANSFPYVIDDVFNLKEGVIGDYADFKVFIFKYGNHNRSLKRYRDARDLFRNSTSFEDFADSDDGCTMVDTQGRTLHMHNYDNYIFIYVGLPETDSKSIFEEIQNNITSH